MTAQPTFSPAPQTVASQTVAGAPAPKRRRAGRIVGFVGVPLVLAGIGVGAAFAVGPRTVQPESVESEIVRITEAAVQVSPADVTCPEGIEAQTGGTFTCTGTVDAQPVTYWVHQDDDEGNLTITYNRLLRLDAVEQSIAAKVASDIEVDVIVDCGPADRAVAVNAPGQALDCTATNATDPTDGARISVTVDAEGNAAYRFV